MNTKRHHKDRGDAPGGLANSADPSQPKADLARPSGKIIPVTLLPLSLLLPTVLHGQFDYTVDGGEETVIGYPGPDGAVSIPDILDGFPVTAIAGAMGSYL